MSVGNPQYNIYKNDKIKFNDPKTDSSYNYHHVLKDSSDNLLTVLTDNLEYQFDTVGTYYVLRGLDGISTNHKLTINVLETQVLKDSVYSDNYFDKTQQLKDHRYS